MKPNKALQATQTPKTTSISKNVLKEPETEYKRVCGADNPFTHSPSIKGMWAGILLSVKLRKEFDLHNGRYELLMQIIYRWVVDGQTSTVYGLTVDYVGLRTHVRQSVDDMIAKGLLEVVGTGYRQARVFIPSQRVIKAVNQVLS